MCQSLVGWRSRSTNCETFDSDAGVVGLWQTLLSNGILHVLGLVTLVYRSWYENVIIYDKSKQPNYTVQIQYAYYTPVFCKLLRNVNYDSVSKLSLFLHFTAVISQISDLLSFRMFSQLFHQHSVNWIK